MTEEIREMLNPPGQYADDRNLRARQRFWQHQDPRFDDVGWIPDLARLSPGMRVLNAGCGNGANADITALPLRDGGVGVALAIHMLYHIPDREKLARPPVSAALSTGE